MKHLFEEDVDMFESTQDPEVSPEVEFYGMDPLEILIALEECELCSA